MSEQDHTALLNGILKGWDKAMGLTFTKATLEEVHAEIEISDIHVQQYGLVHGGVYAGMIEALCSTGAAINAMARGQQGSVGLDNSTSFVRAVRKGTIRAVATPMSRGRRTQVWQADVRDGHGRLLATGRVRLLNLEKGDKPGGEEVKV